MSEPTLALLLCAGCPTLILPKSTTRGLQRKWCSEVCRVRAYAARPGQRERTAAAAKSRRVPVKPAQRTCVVCSAVFDQLGGNPAQRCTACHGLCYKVACPCGRTVWKANRQPHCSARCAGATRRSYPAPADQLSTSKLRRKALERAPGLNRREQRELLAMWQTQSRSCWACPERPTTIDHLIPLSRGGTNYEGNLAPACKSCNSSKGSLLIVEWRWRRGWHGTASGRVAEPQPAAA